MACLDDVNNPTTVEKFHPKTAIPNNMPNQNSPFLSTSQNSSIKFLNKNDDEQYVMINTLYTLNDDSVDSIDMVPDLVDCCNLKKVNINTILDQSVEMKISEEDEKGNIINQNKINRNYYDTITSTFSVEDEGYADYNNNHRDLTSYRQSVKNLIAKKFFL